VQLAGSDCQGEVFRLSAVVVNLSASGLYVELPVELDTGAILTLRLRMSPRQGQEREDEQGATVEAEALVVRRQRLDAQRWGVGLHLLRRRVV
jgi:hypothetical protein